MNKIKTSGFRDTIMEYVGDNDELKRVYCHLIGPISNVIFEKGMWCFNITINDKIRLCCRYKDDGVFFKEGETVEAIGITGVRRRGVNFTVTDIPLLDVKLTMEQRKISEVILLNPRTIGGWICTGKKETEFISAYQSIPYEGEELDDTATCVIGSFARRGSNVIMRMEFLF